MSMVDLQVSPNVVSSMKLLKSSNPSIDTNMVVFVNIEVACRFMKLDCGALFSKSLGSRYTLAVESVSNRTSYKAELGFLILLEA